MKGVEDVLELLDRWRNFPDYQLERRADAFFAVYLPGILEHVLGVPVNPTLIPEFPIKLEESWRSNKVDYFALSKDRSRVFLVELKTDMGSRRAGQDEYLELAKRRGLGELLHHVVGIAERTKQQAKYLHLLKALEELGLLDVPPDLQDIMFSLKQRGLVERIRETKVLQSDAGIEIVYVQPSDWGEPGTIPFESVAEYLETLKDPMARLFSEYVWRWISPAGLPQFGERPAPRPKVTATVAKAMRRTYTIQAASSWDDDINAAAHDFQERFGVFPNLLLASEATYRRIGMLTDNENIRGPDGERPEEGEFCEFGMFRASEYDLECAYDEELADWAIALVYATDPSDGGGIWAPDEDTEEADVSSVASSNAG